VTHKQIFLIINNHDINNENAHILLILENNLSTRAIFRNR
jgi:hypothetical protein